VPPGQRYIIELPTKLIVYGSMGVSAVLFAPKLQAMLGLARAPYTG
jgi:hypothetical protein